MHKSFHNKEKSEEKNDVTQKLCQFFSWTYDPSRQEILTRDKFTNHLKTYPWPSLDAIHNAESKLSKQQLSYYADILCEITYNEKYPDSSDIIHLIHLPLETKLFALIQIVNKSKKS